MYILNVYGHLKKLLTYLQTLLLYFTYNKKGKKVKRNKETKNFLSDVGLTACDKLQTTRTVVLLLGSH